MTDPAVDAALAHPGVQAALNGVERDALTALLVSLMAVPSITGSPEESEFQHQMAGRLDRAGMDADLWQVDLLATLADPDFPGLEADRSEAWGLVGSSGDGSDGPTVVLNGHVDVVPTGPRTQWAAGPFHPQVRDGQVWGRGACDMKGGLACQLAAVTALRDAGVRLRGRVLFESVVGEEDGGLGTFATLRRGYRGDLAVISEPTSAALVPACAGALTFRLSVPGRSVHGSARTSGVDAMEKYLLVHAGLRELEADRNRVVDPLMARYDIAYPLSVGKVVAGDWASSVPGLLVAEGRLGVALGEPTDDARKALEQSVARICAADPWLAENPVRVEWFGGQFASGVESAVSLPGRLVTASHAALNSGVAPSVHGAPYGSDLRLLVNGGGVPTVHYGPGDVRHAHAPNERVPVDELVTVTRTLILLLAAACGTR